MKLIFTLLIQLAFVTAGLAESITRPGSLVSINGSGNSWSGPTLPATTNFSGGLQVSSLLVVSGFDFTAIPPNATIQGLEVVIERSALNDVSDKQVSLIRDGKQLAANRAISGNWSSTRTAQSYGASNDLWGAPSLAGREIRQSLAVAIAVQSTSSSSATVASVSVTVHYVVLAPIILTSFDLTKTPENHVKISWATATEDDVKMLYVERSGNGVNFTPLFTITPSDERNKYIQYSVTDKAPLNGRNYYRLKEVDKDGQVFYFDTKQILIQRSGPGFQAFYNGSDIRLHFSERRGDHQLSLYDAGGNLVRSAVIPIAGNSFQASIPAPSRPGVYIIRLEGDQQSETTRIFVGR
jgi:hypothetical protein